jgi:predicted Fe-Mo cluster-binding NifX family protein
MQTIVAIPIMGASVAPRFESAEYFYVCTLRDAEIQDKRVVSCPGSEGFSRVRFLREQQVECLICSGIKAFYRQMLKSSGVQVIDCITLSVAQALEEFAAGRLEPAAENGVHEKAVCDAPHDDLVFWTRDLFAGYGWRMTVADDSAPFAVDLIGLIDCPVCRRPVRIAVCCGAHIYRCDQEIREFHDATINDFHVRAYIYPAGHRLAECCRAFGIQVINPETETFAAGADWSGKVPLITVPVEGHERLRKENTV